MSSQQIIRRFGASPGAPGVEVVERPSSNALSDPRYGSVWMGGILKRGPMGAVVPVTSRTQYNRIFGDPRNDNWALYAKADHLTPDAIDGYFRVGSGTGQLWITRLDLDGKARAASLVIKNRVGADALLIEAANEGRWGGYKAEIKWTPVIVSTARTFTLIAPGTLSNEYMDAEAEFESTPGRKYKIVSNTEADPDSGECVFTVAAQYNLLVDGVTGPTQTSGTATYVRYPALTGTIAFPLLSRLTGTASVTADTVLGNGTRFLSELTVGDNLYFSGEARTIVSVSSDTTAVVSDAFTVGNLNNVTLSTDNRVVTGTGTAFTTQLQVGDTLYVQIDGDRQGRKVESIASATSLTLASGFTAPVAAGATAEKDGYILTGTDTAFNTELSDGDFIVDPYRSGAAVQIESITSATEVILSKPFRNSFSDVQISRQGLEATVYLDPPRNEGLAVEIGQGQRFPATHFSLNIYFNGTLAMRIDDASLDPQDSLFVDGVVSTMGTNVAYYTKGQTYNTWIRATSLWTSAYTTNEETDVRPCNGSGIAEVVTQRRIYSVAKNFDYSQAIGYYLYPNPYQEYRSSLRVTNAVDPLTLVGTISSIGNTVNGTSTTFLSDFTSGDYLYDPNTREVRRVMLVISDTEMIVESAFDEDIPSLTKGIKAGYLEVGQGFDLQVAAKAGDRFLVVFPETLKGGYDGDTASLLPYYWTKFLDIDRNTVEDELYGKNLGLVRLCCPGQTDPTIIKAGVDYAGARSYEFRYSIPLSFQTASSVESYIDQAVGKNDFGVTAVPSFGYVSNPLGAGLRLVDVTGHIMGGESRYAVDNEGYHVPFAGRRAKLGNVISLPFEISRSDEGIANTAGVQMVKLEEGNIVVKGGRLPSLSETYTFIHIRRSQSNYNRIFLEASALQDLLFRPNQPDLGQQLRMILENFTRREYRKGVLSQHLTYEQAVEIGISGSNRQDIITDQSTNDEIVEIINGILSINLRVTFTGILERLIINVGPNTLVSEYGNTLSNSIGA